MHICNSGSRPWRYRCLRSWYGILLVYDAKGDKRIHLSVPDKRRGTFIAYRSSAGTCSLPCVRCTRCILLPDGGMSSWLADFYRDGGYLALPVQKNAAYSAGGVPVCRNSSVHVRKVGENRPAGNGSKSVYID